MVRKEWWGEEPCVHWTRLSKRETHERACASTCSESPPPSTVAGLLAALVSAAASSGEICSPANAGTPRSAVIAESSAHPEQRRRFAGCGSRAEGAKSIFSCRGMMGRHFREGDLEEGNNSGRSCRDWSSGIQIDDLRRVMCAARNGRVGAIRGGLPQIRVKWPTGSRRRRRWRPCRRTPSLPADRQHKPAKTAVSLRVSPPPRADKLCTSGIQRRDQPAFVCRVFRAS